MMMTRNELWAHSLCRAIAKARGKKEQIFYITWVYDLGFAFYPV